MNLRFSILWGPQLVENVVHLGPQSIWTNVMFAVLICTTSSENLINPKSLLAE